MNRPQPRAARPWLLRALLVLFTLTGLGIWQGGHCADPRPAPGTATVAAVSAPAAAGPVVPAHHLGLTVDPHSAGTPAAATGPCHIVSSTVTTTTVATTSVLPATERVAATPPRPPSLTPCFSSGVALVRLGVSRT